MEIFRQGTLLAVLTFAFHIGIITGSPLSETSALEGERVPRAKSDVNTQMLEKINVDKYLKNERAVRQQIKCILKNGPCDSVGKEIKKLMPMIVKGSQICEECTPQQLEIINKIINHLKTNYPAEWAEGVEKFGAPAHA